MSTSSWGVGRVAERAGVSVSTLHFYERKGLISSHRNAANQRRYHADVLRRIAVIKAAQKLGLSLEEIQCAFASLPEHRTPTVADWARLSATWRDLLNERIAYLQRLRDNLNGCIGCGCLSLKACPIYNDNDYLGNTACGAVLLQRGSR